MKHFKRGWETPPGGWKWEHPETKHAFSAGSINALAGQVRAYCRANQFPIPVQLEQRLEDDNCERCEAMGELDLCEHEGPPTVLEMGRRFVRSMTEWASSGFKVVAQGDFYRRLDICEGCSMWNGESAFGLGRCGKCGCTSVKLYLATEKCPLKKW